MKDKTAILYTIIKTIIKPIFILLYHPKIINEKSIPKEGSLILAGNHRHLLDPVLLGISTKRKIHFLAKIELHNSIFGFIFKAAGTIPVDRGKDNSESKKAAIECLKEGKVIGIFPEGTRNHTKDILLPFKMGSVKFAKEAKSIIIPFATLGNYNIFKKNLKIIIGKPLIIWDMELEEANDLLKANITELINKLKEDK